MVFWCPQVVKNKMSSLATLQKAAEKLYPFDPNMSAPLTVKRRLFAASEKSRQDYIAACIECERNPTYFIMMAGVPYPCICEPLLNDVDNSLHKDFPEGPLGSWQKVKNHKQRRITRPQNPAFENYD